MSTSCNKWDEDELILPGFRFHPTDEELVAFYLRRKVENKHLSIELIKQIDIYKYEPWELPTISAGADEQEWYFFCLRGRKYRNSVRPNRVTGSGFWKATGIDKPIYSFKESHECIGLKKSLVYYRGSAGKGYKTDWMMHEFRLPPQRRNSTGPHSNLARTSNIALEAEVWTLCRIFKRITSYKKYIPAQPQPKFNFSSSLANSSSKTYSNESDHNNNDSSSDQFYLSFADQYSSSQQNHYYTTQVSSLTSNSFDHPSCAGIWNANGQMLFSSDDCGGEDWDELRPVVDPYAIDCE